MMEMDYGGKRRADIENSLKKADLSHTKVSDAGVGSLCACERILRTAPLGSVHRTTRIG